MRNILYELFSQGPLRGLAILTISFLGNSGMVESLSITKRVSSSMNVSKSRSAFLKSLSFPIIRFSTQSRALQLWKGQGGKQCWLTFQPVTVVVRFQILQEKKGIGMQAVVLIWDVSSPSSRW